MSSVPIGLETLTPRWWVPVVRGLAAVIFGILAFVAPAISLLALVVVWGVYALVDGAFNLVLAVKAGRAGQRWGWFIFEGLISIGAGVVTFAYPGITALVLLLVIAAWAVVTGILEIAAAIELRRVMKGEWLLALSGVLSVLLGVLLFANPGAGALAVVWLIGLYAILFGVLLIGLGVQLHRWGRRGAGVPPTTVAPAPA